MPDIRRTKTKRIWVIEGLVLFFCFLCSPAYSADTTSPTGSIKINNNASYTNATSVTLNISAVDSGSGVDGMKFSNNNSTWSLAESYATTKSWTLSSGNGTKTVYVQFKDNAGNWSKAYSDAIILDTGLPTGKISINNNAAKTKSLQVTLNLSASDSKSGVSQMCFSNDNSAYSAPEPYSTSKSWVLTFGDGLKTIYAKFRDGAGNWSASYSGIIILDTTLPVISNVTAANIAGTSTQISWDTNEPSTSQVEYGLTANYGNKSSLSSSLVTTRSISIKNLKQYTLYHYRAISQDSIGNRAVSQDYTLTTKDTTAPIGSIKVNNDATSTNSSNVTLNLFATDSGSGVAQMQLSNNNSSWFSPETYATTKNWVLSAGTGKKTVYVKYKDNAGNWSTVCSDSITLITFGDIIAPTGTIKINNNNQYTNSTSATLTLSAQDDLGGSGMNQMQFSNDGIAWFDAEPYLTSKNWVFPSGDGAKTVYVKFSDIAGNWAAVVSDTIILDTAPPQITILSPLDNKVIGPQ
jgi:large repetitive protein